MLWSPPRRRLVLGARGHGAAAPMRSDRRSAPLPSAAAAAAQTMETFSAQAPIVNTDSPTRVEAQTVARTPR